jgi:basic membrane protein A
VVVAGSFLLTDAVSAAARSRPNVRFILVDPLAMPALEKNLAVIAFREDQAAFLAGALAAMLTRTRVVAGVYGPEGGAMTRYRHGFEQGIAATDPGIRVLGAYQPATEGAPFGNPRWGGQAAGSFRAQGADIVFGAGGLSGEGALLAAEGNPGFCIGAGTDQFLSDLAARSCLLTSVVTHPDRAVEAEVLAAIDGRWKAGVTFFGLAGGSVGLAPFHQFEAAVTPAIRERLMELTDELAAGRYLEGN